MDQKVKEVIKKIQCPGCMDGDFDTCFSPNEHGEGCGAHYAGTIIIPIGKIFLGLPKGFCRLGEMESMKPRIFRQYNDSYDKFNVPVWKHRTKEGLVLVRGLKPRLNTPFIDVFIEDCFDKINCMEITEDDIDAMD